MTNNSFSPDTHGADSYKWVDLGLPSGQLWARCNVGAVAPEDFGDYFAWGENKPKGMYDDDTYIFLNRHGKLTKYCNVADCGVDDNLTRLKPADDAATANFGWYARMPTDDEWQELLDNCRSEWTQQNGVY